MAKKTAGLIAGFVTGFVATVAYKAYQKQDTDGPVKDQMMAMGEQVKDKVNEGQAMAKHYVQDAKERLSARTAEMKAEVAEKQLAADTEMQDIELAEQDLNLGE
ncbi:hypothetical protein PT274_05465 [Leuconostocaceae bacterium ESL0958]|nr:hypothetical protein [Leuconostocaceae bacterium ESL0958]